MHELITTFLNILVRDLLSELASQMQIYVVINIETKYRNRENREKGWTIEDEKYVKIGSQHRH